MDSRSNLQLGVLFLQRVHRVGDLLPGLQPLIGPTDVMVHFLSGIQPLDGVLQHVVELLRPIRELGLRVLPVSLKPLNYKDN